MIRFFGIGLLAALVLLPSAQAKEIRLMRITSNATPIVFDFAAVTDDATGALQGMSLYQDGERVRYDSFDDVKRGITILRISKLGISVDVTKLRGAPRLDSRDGGELVLTMLRDFLRKDYRELHLDVVPTSDGSWALYLDESSGRIPVDRLYMKGYTILGQPRGVKSVTAYDHDQEVGDLDTKELAKE